MTEKAQEPPGPLSDEADKLKTGSVMEQAHAGKCHRYPQFVAAIYHCVIADRSARLRNITYSGCSRSLYIIEEREEGVRSA